MRKIKILLKIVAFSLAILLIVQILPLSIVSTAINNNLIIEKSEIERLKNETPIIVSEVDTLRDEYTKHFRCEDGTFVAAVYNTPVHYQENGKWKDIDNTLVSNTQNSIAKNTFVNNEKYSITKTATPITFPESINNGKITIARGNNVISFGIKNSDSSILSVATVSAPEELVSTSISGLQAKKEEKVTNDSDLDFIADTRNSAITYANAFENASVEYEISSSIIKESIVIPEKSDNYKYEFSINFGSYIPVADKDGGINIYETAQSAEPVMAIAPPYMFDADNNVSENVTMDLIADANDYTLIIEADKDWINSFGRKFPVVIDPTFELDVGRDAIYDVHVNNNKPDKNYDADYQLEVGRNLNNIFRTYIKYDLPSLPDLSVITYANIKLVQNWLRNFDDDAPYLNVYECPTSWNLSSITWNNQPISDLSSATVVDYTNLVDGMGTEYNLNITKIVKNWYENGENYGLMLASSDETVKEKTSFYSSRNIVSNYPVITICYVNNSGIENYWDYETVSLGTSGTAYINTYNGGLTYIHEDVATNGLLAPVGISHIYSTDSKNASGTYLGMKFGGGFSLNILERIESVSDELSESYPYKYIDADATVHFFTTTSTANQYKYEFDEEILLTCNENSTSSRFVMSFYDGSSKHFNSNGYLTKTVDPNGNTVLINYSGNRISTVTDGAGKKLTFSYNSDNTLKHIADPALSKIQFTYSEQTGRLITVTYPDGNQTSYDYNNAGLLSKITAIDSSQIRFGYKTTAVLGSTVYRVSEVSSHTCDTTHTLINSISFAYRTGDTLITNNDGDNLVVAFDNSGRAVNKTVNGESVSIAGYNQSGNLNNAISFASNTFTVSEDVTNASFPARSPGWSTKYSDSNNKIYNGMCFERLNTSVESLKIGMGYTPGTIYSEYKTTVSVGEAYTVSGYVSILDELTSGTVSLKLLAVDSAGNTLAESQSAAITTTDNEWKLLTATIRIPENTAKMHIRLGLFEGIGTVYLDCVWTEKGETPNRFNIIQNPSFSSTSSEHPYLWATNVQGYFPLAYEDSNRRLKLIGNPAQAFTAIQTQEIHGKAGDVLIFGARSKANCSSSGNNGHRFYGMRIYLKQSLDIVQVKTIEFNKEVTDTWQTILGTMKAEQDYSYIEVELCYEYEVNTALFDDVFVYRDAFGTYYSYNADGTIKKANDDNGNSVEYSYNPNKDISQIKTISNGQTTSNTLYNYNSNHNLTSVAQTGKVTTTYTYPDVGNKGLPISVTVTDSLDRSATTTYQYCDNYNLIKSVTDSSGATVEYEYDYGEALSDCLLTTVTDPNGYETEYTYDCDSNLLAVVSNFNNNLEVPETELIYGEGRKLTGISDPDNYYSISYNNYGTAESIGINGNNSIITNQYDSKGRLDTVTYANSSSAQIVYDDKDRVSQEIYDGETAFRYYYNKNGSLGKVIDNENGTEWIYQYDLAGRLTCITSDDNRTVFYSYNDKNETQSVKITDNNSVLLNTRYSYDYYGTPTKIDVLSMAGTPSQSYTVDDFGRINAVANTYNSANAQNKVLNNYSYLTNDGNQTGRIDSISYIKSAADSSTALLPELSYAYDANGNITHIYENEVQKVKYYYDCLNRLVREDNGYIDKTVVYSYDICGDILAKTEYALTSDETLGTSTDTISYAYSDSVFKNGVTLYDGTDSIIYDANGNPTSYRGYAMEWVKGRQLESISNEDISLSFKYDNNGIRTKKTVNGVDTEYFYVGDMLVSQKTGNEVINFAYSAGGAPYGFTYNGSSYFYLLNLQGDVIGIYDSNGDVVAKYTYDSWGKLISVTGSLASTIGIKNPLRYRGYYYDTETGLYYLQSRYYDPETCRFINADSLLIAGNDYIQGTNMYAYCYNNPVMYSDASGRETTGDLIYTVTGVLFGLLYISQHVPLSVLSGYISSMFGHDFETGREKADYILRIAEAYLPQEGWSTQYPYPTKITNVGFQVIMDGRFISKNYCLEYSDAIIKCFGNGNTYLGMDRERMAVEIYGHAMIHFCLPTIKKTPIYNMYEEQIDSFYTSSDPIDVNYNEGSGRLLVFYALWNLT